MRIGLAVSPSRAHIDDDHPLRHPDLRRGQPDADRLVHRLQHVVHQPAHLVVDLGDGLRLELEARVGRGDDRKQSHVA